MSEEEEKLAQKAIAQVRGWIQKERKSRGRSFSPSLAFKFCGGCNPSIERGILAQAIREDLTGMVRWVSWEDRPDLVVIINGCLTACVEWTSIQKKAWATLAIQGRTLSGIEKNPAPEDSFSPAPLPRAQGREEEGEGGP